MPPMDAKVRSAIDAFLARASEHHPISAAWLFGSRARGTHHDDSDADVAMLLDEAPRPFLPTKLALADPSFDVLRETGVYVQALPIWRSEWEAPDDYPNPCLLHAIRREGVSL